MKRNVVPIVVFAFALSMIFVGVSVPADPGNSVSAIVKNIDLAGSTLTVQTPEGIELAYSVDSRTKIVLNGQPGTLADLKAGQSVQIEAKGRKAVTILA